jgi:modulator of FtsH protease
VRDYARRVDPAAFAATLDSWHDFYVAVGSASAALLGLLFVGVSINLESVVGSERVELRTRANLAFSNLLYLLGLSLVVLIPGVESDTVAISFAVIAALGLIRIARHALALRQEGPRVWERHGTVRRLAWTFIADVVLLAIAAALAVSGDAGWLKGTPIVVAVLLLGSADVAWDLLVRESEDAGPTKDA